MRVAARVKLDLKLRDYISNVLCENYIGCQSVNESYNKLCFLVHKASLVQSPDYITDMLQPVAAIPVLTAGRQSRRLRRPTDKPENGGSSIFRRRNESVEPAAD